MNLQQMTSTYTSNNASSWGGKAANLGKLVSDNSLRLVTDTVDLGAGTSLAFGALQGVSKDVVTGTSIVMGAGHAVKAIVNLCQGTDKAEYYGFEQARPKFTMAAGEALTSVGLFCAAGGVGPVSMAFLGLGAVITTASDLAA